MTKEPIMTMKSITAALALVALAAFALPGVASASPELTHPTGTTLATGTRLTVTNIGNVLWRSGGTILSECNRATLTGELIKNNGTRIEGNVTTATLTGTGAQDPAEAANMPECTSPVLGNTIVTTNGGGIDENTVANGTPWCLKATTEDNFSVRGGLCSAATRNIDFILKSTTGGPCTYTRAAAITGTYTTDGTGDAMLTFTNEGTEFTKKEGGFLCPGTFAFEMKFTVEADSVSAEPGVHLLAGSSSRVTRVTRELYGSLTRPGPSAKFTVYSSTASARLARGPVNVERD
jgi:hypothetical protein